jgi:hypothetical protein
MSKRGAEHFTTNLETDVKSAFLNSLKAIFVISPNSVKQIDKSPQSDGLFYFPSTTLLNSFSLEYNPDVVIDNIPNMAIFSFQLFSSGSESTS